MPVFEGEVSFVYPYVIDANDLEDAEYVMLDLAKEDFPEATHFTVEKIKEIKN